ncbi:MAG: hypothetical protein HOC78_03690 [Candidatus Komeilibacteria bacterium]|jgi:hypothetical protein|nr:hypothetical protein [Candidatus Komeilibacteria bacterium]
MKQKNVILALFILILAGSFIYLQINRPIEEDNLVNTNQSEEQIDLSAEALAKMDTSGWLTYRNEEYGFEFKYKKEWDINEEYKKYYDYDFFNIILGDKIHFKTFVLNNSIDSLGVIEKYNNLNNPEWDLRLLEDFYIENVILDNYSVGKYKLPNNTGDESLIFIYNNKAYEIDYNLNENEFNQFINSFKFID